MESIFEPPDNLVKLCVLRGHLQHTLDCIYVSCRNKGFEVVDKGENLYDNSYEVEYERDVF